MWELSPKVDGVYQFRIFNLMLNDYEYGECLIKNGLVRPIGLITKGRTPSKTRCEFKLLRTN